jgi:hypothetical protein
MGEEQPQEPRGSTEDDPTVGKPPIYTIPIIWEPCVLKFMNTEIVCKIVGSMDPSKPRSCFIANREGKDPVPEHAKKWLARFLADAPPDTTWGKVQAAAGSGHDKPDTHTTANIANSKPPRGSAG